jgi:hypothetical protein
MAQKLKYIYHFIVYAFPEIYVPGDEVGSTVSLSCPIRLVMARKGILFLSGGFFA